MFSLGKGAAWATKAFAIRGSRLALLCSLALMSAPALAEDFFDLPLEELMQKDVAVVSAAKRDESLTDTPAAVFVITREDIRRSGATHIPDVLRMAPGIQVGRISANEWAVSARGLSGRFSRHLLVMIDGRSLFTSLFSGVNWDEVNLNLEDIDRIEIMRGPAGAIWGANAVNGMIHIITRKATQGAAHQLRSTAGNGEEKHSVYGRFALRHPDASQGGSLSLSHREQGELTPVKNPPPWPDARSRDWSHSQLDARFDGRSQTNIWTLTAGALHINAEVPWQKQSVQAPWTPVLHSEESKTGGYATGEWRRSLSLGEWRGALRTDWMARDTDAYRWDSRSQDVDVQWSGALSDHDITLGFGFRNSLSAYRSAPQGLDIVLTPAKATTQTRSLFFQDRYALTQTLATVISARWDAFSDSRRVFQPSLRLAWEPRSGHQSWLAWTRAASTPSQTLSSESRLDLFTVPPSSQQPLPLRLSLMTTGSLVDQTVVSAWEWGYRYQYAKHLGLDIALYHHQYEGIAGVALPADRLPELVTETIEGVEVPYLRLPAYFTTQEERNNRGAELALFWQASRALFIQWSASTQHTDFAKETTPFSQGFNLADSAPRWQQSLRGLINTTQNTQLNLWLKGMGAWPRTALERYWALDMSYSLQLSRGFSLSINAHNLGTQERIEFGREIANASYFAVKPYYFLKLDWQR